MEQRTFHPSNRLYNGECARMDEAFRLMIAQYRQEISWIQRHYMELFPDDGAAGIAELRASIAVVEQCREEYLQVILEAETALFARWQASDNEELKRIGEAGDTGDYSLLAL